MDLDLRLAVVCDAPVLISAPTRREAETTARRIHSRSRRADRPFVAAECSGLTSDVQPLSETLAGLIGAASGGTLFLAGLEDVPTAAQQVLIAVLEAHASRRGRASVRVLSATSSGLFERVQRGAFSSALYYRLNALHVSVHS